MSNAPVILIRGIGPLSALGIGRAEQAAALAEGESALLPPLRITPPEGATELAGEVPPFDLAALLGSAKAYLDRNSELLLAATALALADARLARGALQPERTGLAVGTAWGALDTMSAFFADYVNKGPRLVKPMLFPHAYANAAISLAAMEWELRGPHLNFVSGRLAAAQALLAALDALRAGEAERMLAGGVEALGATLWRTLLAAGCRVPPGEGAAMLLLERAAGESVDGARFAGGAEAATGREAIAAALRDAAIPPAAIGRAVLSAAGDPAREAVEREALRQALGRDVETFLPGALYGETQGACGVLQVACALLTHPPSPATPALLTLTSDPAGGAVALLLLPAPSPLW